MTKIDFENLSFVKVLISVLTPLVLLSVGWANLSSGIKSNTEAIETNKASIIKLEEEVKNTNQIVHQMDKRLVRVEEKVGDIREDVAYIRKKLEEQDG